MTRPNTPTLAALDAMIEQLQNSRPDLNTQQGLLDYRTLLLAQTGRAMLDLPELNPDAAVFLYHLALDRYRGLVHLQALTEGQAKELVGGLVALYGQWRPELLPRILTPEEVEPHAD